MQETKKTENTTIIASIDLPPNTRIRQIGNTTFIVSSRFKEGKDGDIISTFARLIQYDNEKRSK